MSDFVRACAAEDVAPETAISVEIGDEEVAIVHSGGHFFAIRDECSHATIPLSEGDVGDREVECWMHGSRFDLTTGEPTGLPATEAVPVYPVRLEGADVLVDVAHPIPV